MIRAQTLPPFLFTSRFVRVLRHLPEFTRLYASLFRDRRVSLLPKALLILIAVYLVSPIDLVPAFIPVLGQLDDLGVLLGGLWLFIRLCPPDVVAETVHEVARTARS
ncbi:MAG: hypothetical protein QOD06_698 [Candidatus Binatota bacterium]|nr:hypothetical protein [Candidatus Binatota bacterium]